MTNRTFLETMIKMDYKTVLERINSGCDINMSIGQGRIFEWLLSSKDETAIKALDKVLTHPSWNPNYCTPDGLSPLERALIHKRTDIALKIINHPNIKKDLSPRVIQLAAANSTKKFQNMLKKRMQNQR